MSEKQTINGPISSFQIEESKGKERAELERASEVAAKGEPLSSYTLPKWNRF